MNTPQRFFIDEDADVLERFRDDFETAALAAEELALELETTPDNLEALDRLRMLVKELYSFAFNANIIPLIEPLTTLDDFLILIGDTYPTKITHPLTLLIDRFLLIAKEVAEQSSISMQAITNIQKAIQPLARLKDRGNVDDAITQVINVLLGNYKEDTRSDDEIELFDDVDLFDDIELFDESFNSETPEPAVTKKPEPEQRIEVDELELIQLEMSILKNNSTSRTLAEYIDTRHKFWVGRSFFLLSMAIKLNAEAGTKVNPEDLANAVFLHDFPMVRLSDEVLYSREIDRHQLRKIQEHTTLAYEMALMLNCSKDVADMVYQHHERPDGKGYPAGLSGNQICDGAKIIAICDAYYAMTNYKVTRKVKRSALRTVAEINACAGTQFDEFWVKIFNKVVKKYNMLANI